MTRRKISLHHKNLHDDIWNLFWYNKTLGKNTIIQNLSLLEINQSISNENVQCLKLLNIRNTAGQKEILNC